MKADITAARKGDIIRFQKYALRVDEEPVMGRSSITLKGRISIDGCPFVTKHFLAGRIVEIERAD